MFLVLSIYLYICSIVSKSVILIVVITNTVVDLISDHYRLFVPAAFYIYFERSYMPTIIIYGLVFFVFFIPCLSLFIYIWYCIRVYTILFRRSVFKRSYERTLFQNSDLDYCPFINILPFPSLILLLQLLQKPSQCSVLCSQISFSFNKKKFIQKFRTAF